MEGLSDNRFAGLRQPAGEERCGKRGFGRILNVATAAGRIARADDLNYGPSKAYVHSLSEPLDLTLKPHGVLACALYPGFTRTEFRAAAELLERTAALPDFVWYDAEVVVRAVASLGTHRAIEREISQIRRRFRSNPGSGRAFSSISALGRRLPRFMMPHCPRANLAGRQGALVAPSTGG